MQVNEISNHDKPISCSPHVPEPWFDLTLPLPTLAAVSSSTMGSIDTPAQKMAANYVLKQANSKEDMDRIMDVIWAANYEPYEPFVQLFFPVLGFTPADREASLAKAKERFWNQHLADSSSNWFYVIEAHTGKPVGCAQWQIQTSNPFPNGVPVLTAPWWPKGEHREFCELILNQVYKPRASWMQRPNLGECFSVPRDFERRALMGKQH